MNPEMNPEVNKEQPILADAIDDAELRRRLQALPQEAAPPFAWSEIRERRERRREAGARRRPRMLYVAAAIACVGLGGVAIWQRLAATPPSDVASSWPYAATATDAATRAAEEFDEFAAAGSREPALVRVDERIVTAALEDRIAWFDDALTDARAHDASSPRVRELETTRRQLADSLQRVRYADALAAQVP